MTKDSMEMLRQSSLLGGGSGAYLEQQFETYTKDPGQVSPEWRSYFQQLPKSNGTDQDAIHSQIREDFRKLIRMPNVRSAATANAAGPVSSEHERKQSAVRDLIHAYRLLGHLYSQIDPLKLKEKMPVPELELSFYHLNESDHSLVFDAAGLPGSAARPLKQILADLKRIYCGTVAPEYMHIPDSAERAWLQEKIESTFIAPQCSKEIQQRILEDLIAAEGLEKYLASKYPGAKRFGLEGCDSLIALLNELIQRGGAQGINEVVMGMAHRGRLNVLVNILGKMPSELFDEFEGKHSKEVESGDVKYHQGFSSDIKTTGGYVHLSLAFNPSHLEIVTPVMSGSVRARQERRGQNGRSEVLSISMHGDSAFAGQGVVMETMNMSQTRGYAIGGTIRIIINNQVGFTTSNVRDTRSTLYCCDIGKMIMVPIFHVNAEDPEGLCAVAAIALEYRRKFQKDVIIDLIGYRRHGHNEADEPRATQPVMYQIIKSKPTAREIYAERLIQANIFTAAEVDQMVENYRKTLDERSTAVARDLVKDGWKSEYSTNWAPYETKDWRHATSTALPLDRMVAIANARDTVPENFKLHPRVQKVVEDRKSMTAGQALIDWGYAETLAYATLLVEGYAVRLSGQDCGRGTFFHRHAVWHEQSTGQTHTSLQHLGELLNEKQGSFCVIDSLLSEAAVLGFEYGFSTSEPRALVIWEAQFGDFANSAQVVMDQFISSGEQKWGRLSGLTMLLPHGYEGQGPEHSSARLERYMQLCAQHNIQVCIPSTPAQVYHMLRRQILRPMRKPLVVMSPKSLLRHKEAVSTLEELSQGSFKVILTDTSVDKSKVKRVILCSGKVYYELKEARKEKQYEDAALVRIEQAYPFPELELAEELNHYPNLEIVVWCQEEPQNQGVWYSTQHHLRRCVPEGKSLIYAGREAAAAPAAGYAHLHQHQQNELVMNAFTQI